MTTSHGIRARWTITAAIAALAFTSACAGDDDGGTKGSTADKSPIVVGVINQSAGAVAYKPYEEGVQAAAAYINAEGGVDGHPIKLDVCATDGTPATTQRCAQGFVSSKPLFVTTGIDNNMNVAYPLLEAASIPVIGGIAVNASDFTSEDAFFYESGTIGAASGAAELAIEVLGAKDVGAMVLDIPQTAIATSLARAPIEGNGGTLTESKVTPTTSDFLSPLTSLKPNDRDAILTFQSQAGCLGIAKAAASQKLTTTFIAPGPCNDVKLIKSAAGAMDGWYVWSAGPDLNGDDPANKVYLDALKEHQPKAQPSSLSQSTFGFLMTTYENVLKPLGFDDLTSESVKKAVADPKGGELFYGGTYKCGEVEAYRSLCSMKTYWWQVQDEDGTLKAATPDGEPIDSTEYVAKYSVK